VPAHVTIIFPFVPVDRLTDADLLDLGGVFAGESAFEMTLTRFGRFPGRPGDPETLWLAPDPAGPFHRLTAAMTDRWPEAPPYCGMFDEVVPHLTVTETAPAAIIEQAQAAVEATLPVFARIQRGSLIVFDGVVWRERAALPLSGPPGLHDQGPTRRGRREIPMGPSSSPVADRAPDRSR
jgi:2'-5' RNA ligase